MLGQQFDKSWIDIAVVVVIVVISVLTSAGRWIVRQLETQRQKQAQRRQEMSPESGSAPIDQTRDVLDPRTRPRPPARNIPPFAAPAPTVSTRRAEPETAPPPVMERVLEVLLEKTAGTPMEKRLREAVARKAPPPLPPQRTRPEKSVQRSSSSRSAPVRKAPVRSLVEREALETEVERETRRLAQREERFAAGSERRMGQVETHIASSDVRDATLTTTIDVAPMLEDPDTLRRAIVLTEILGPPVALREDRIV